MKVFISQPMNGKDEQTILEERAEMVSRIKEQYPDAEILESYFEDYNPSTGNVGLKYLSKSLELLADADEAWFAPGWQNARGCRIENDCAIAYGIAVHEIYYSMNEDMPKQAAQPKWISVDERMPEREVLAANFAPRTYGYKEYIIGYVSEEKCTEHGKCCASNDYEILYNVTHWMPLPEPPKEDVKNERFD